MDLADYGRFVAALVAVLALIGLIALAMRRWGPAAARIGLRTPGRRLAIVEILPIDPRRRLLIVRRDDVEHLLLVGHPGEATVVERGIAPPAGSTPPRTTDTAR